MRIQLSILRIMWGRACQLGWGQSGQWRRRYHQCGKPQLQLSKACLPGLARSRAHACASWRPCLAGLRARVCSAFNESCRHAQRICSMWRTRSQGADVQCCSVLEGLWWVEAHVCRQDVQPELADGALITLQGVQDRLHVGTATVCACRVLYMCWYCYLISRSPGCCCLHC